MEMQATSKAFLCREATKAPRDLDFDLWVTSWAWAMSCKWLQWGWDSSSVVQCLLGSLESWILFAVAQKWEINACLCIKDNSSLARNSQPNSRAGAPNGVGQMRQFSSCSQESILFASLLCAQGGFPLQFWDQLPHSWILVCQIN